MPEVPIEECIGYVSKPYHGPHFWTMPNGADRQCPGKRIVPTNAELAEAAKDKTLFDVYRGWLERHPMRRVGLSQEEIDTWLDWAANNMIDDPEIGAVTRRINQLHMEVTEVETVAEIAEYLRWEARGVRYSNNSRDGHGPVINGAIRFMAAQIEGGQWHKYSKEPEQSNPELWR